MEIFNVKKIEYSGKDSRDLLSFKYYNPEEIILGKKMSEHLRFSVAFWHTFNADGTDMFGVGTMLRPWDKYTEKLMHLSNSLKNLVWNIFVSMIET